jgi:hypothetical protein
MWDKTVLTEQLGFEDFIRTAGASGWELVYGANINALFKPFTTLNTADGVPHYRYFVLPSGFAGATASGLNPFGPNTIFEGIVWGSGIGSDLESSIDPNYVRTYGHKGPMHLVGWGFDNFGYPAPNAVSGWEGYGASGVFGSTVPGTGWMGSGFAPANHGRLVPPPFYRAGPIDMRWNQLFGTWGGAQSVYSAHVVSTRIGSVTTTDPTGVYDSTGIRYNVKIFDGIANQMLLTGVYHVGAHPSEYFVNPLGSGDFCLIVHTIDTGGIPRYGIYMYEPPGVEACGESLSESLFSTYGGPDDGDPVDTSGYLRGDYFFDGLAANPIELQYGGLGFNTITENQILIGNASGNLTKKILQVGSGLAVNVSSGTVSIDLGVDVQFSVSGINTTITELQGLTVPLSLSQGGTGSSVKNFVDLGSSQTVSGFKTFRDTIRSNAGTLSNLGLAFASGSTNFPVGLLLASSGAIGFASSGEMIAEIGTLRTAINRTLRVQNTSDPVISGAAIEVYDTLFGSGLALMQGFAATGDMVYKLDHVGISSPKALHTLPQSNIIPVKITQLNSTGLRPMEVYDGSTRRWSISERKDAVYFDEGIPGATGGFIKITAASGFTAGYIDLSASGIDAGYIRTAGGGSIDTSGGFIQFGPAGSRSTLEVPVTSGDRRYTFSSTTGTLATQQYVLQQIDAMALVTRDVIPFVGAHRGVAPATLYAQFDFILGASTPAETFPVVAFDDTTNEYMDYILQLPPNFSGTGFNLNVHYGTSGTSATGVMGFAVRRLNDNSEDLDTTAHTYDYQYKTFPALSTYGYKSSATVLIASGLGFDQLLAGEMFTLRTCRVASSGLDTLSGDLFMYGFSITQG